MKPVRVLLGLAACAALATCNPVHRDGILRREGFFGPTWLIQEPGDAVLELRLTLERPPESVVPCTDSSSVHLNIGKLTDDPAWPEVQWFQFVETPGSNQADGGSPGAPRYQQVLHTNGPSPTSLGHYDVWRCDRDKEQHFTRLVLRTPPDWPPPEFSVNWRIEIWGYFETDDQRVADAQNFTVERLDPSGTWVPLFNAVWDIGWNAAPLDAGYMTGSSPWDGTWPAGFDAGMAGIPDGG